MAKPKANVQWAPGTRLSRFNKEDGQYEYEMELLRKKDLNQVKEKRDQPFCYAELVMDHMGDITRLGAVDPDGDFVMHKGVKVGAECFKKLPGWFHEAYSRLEAELAANGTV